MQNLGRMGKGRIRSGKKPLCEMLRSSTILTVEARIDRGAGRRNGNVILQTESAIAPSPYQQSLDDGIPDPGHLTTETVRYWSDFNRVFYHPRSIVQINDYELGSSLMPFEKWDSGNELFMNLDREEDLLDRDLRPWAEECDQMQGVQIWTGADDAWGGFAAKYAERVRDEFGKMGVWVWGIEEEKGRGQRVSISYEHAK